jgi:hypothetical protein
MNGWSLANKLQLQQLTRRIRRPLSKHTSESNHEVYLEEWLHSSDTEVWPKGRGPRTPQNLPLLQTRKHDGSWGQKDCSYFWFIAGSLYTDSMQSAL